MKSYDVVIIGGGVLGGAVAFYLAKRGVENILLLERNSIAHGNSSLAAGLLTRGRFKPALIPMVLETYQAIHEVEAVTGRSLHVHRTGCMYAAVSHEHQKNLRELAASVGYTFYIEPGPVAGASIAYWGPVLRVGAVQKPLNVDMDVETNVQSVSCTFDSRSDLTSLPFSMMPTSSVSRMS